MENLQIIIDYLKESERNHFEEEPSKEHIFVKTILAGQELRKLKEVTNTENKLAEIISHLSLNPTEKLEAEFQSLLAKKRLLLSKQSS